MNNPTSSGQLVLKTVCSTTTVVYGQTYRVAGPYDGAAIKIYVNGTAENTLAVTGAITTDQRPLTIGAGDSALFGGGFANQLQGLIDEVQVYNRALTGQEVQAGGVFKAGAELP